MRLDEFLTSIRGGRLLVLGILLLFPLSLRAQLFVDCSGTNPGVYPSINAALQAATNGSTILVTGPCNETVNLQGWNGLNLGAWYGKTATLNGALSISNSHNIFLYGLQITNSPVDGVTVSDSTAVFLDSCTSSGNTLNGLRVQDMSDVGVLATGAFNNNGSSGIWSNINSLVVLNGWAGPVDVNDNVLDGIECEQATCVTFGNTNLRRNGITGIDLVAGAKMEFAAYYGPNVVESNKSGGVSLRERSRMTISTFNQQNIIRGNGQVGVAVGFGSQLTLSGVQITNHASAGLDIYANSQAWLFGATTIQSSGNDTDARSAGILVDGNSEAFLRGGDVSHNIGPGMLVLVNSSVDFAGVTAVGNSGGVIACDDTAIMVSDLSRAGLAPPAGIRCKTPHALGNRPIPNVAPNVPDLSPHKALHEKYRRLATRN